MQLTFRKNLDKACWSWLSENPNAIHILEKNLDKACWVLCLETQMLSTF